MKPATITLGSTGISTLQNAFGALPIQRIPKDDAVRLLRRAYEGGMTFFDTARSYTDSEEKVGAAFSGIREKVFISSKTGAKNPKDFRAHLETSLRLLGTDYIDIYQFHCAQTCYAPGDGTGMYECMLEAKAEGKILHIGLTTHKITVAKDCVASGLYETLQFPFSYLSSDQELALADECLKKNMGLLAMKALAGGLITDSASAFAFISQYPAVLPIWGIQRESELEEWLSYNENAPVMTDAIRESIKKDIESLEGDFCRGCGYCMPCPAGIQINTCARMSLLLRRAPTQAQLDERSREMMSKIEDCLWCRSCMKRCPYELNIPELLRKNLEDYKTFLK